jgi:hypothetical protein
MQHTVSSIFQSQIKERILKCEGNSIIQDDLRWRNTVEKQYKNVMLSRLNAKMDEISNLAKFYRNDWETLAFIYIGKYWVDNQNRLAVERLLQSVPISFVKRSPLKELLAYVWILGGFERIGSDLITSNQFDEQMKFLKNKFQIKSLDISWYYGKIRPQGWVQNRLIQYFVWLHGLDGQISDVLIDQTWCTQERFMMDSPHFSYLGSKLGLNVQQASKVIANAIIPLQLAYSKHRETSQIDFEIYLDCLRNLPAEDNRIVRNYSPFFGNADSAFHSQALTHQIHEFCRAGRCSTCEIGRGICS